MRSIHGLPRTEMKPCGLTRILVWLLALSMIVPPAALAQFFGGPQPHSGTPQIPALPPGPMAPPPMPPSGIGAGSTGQPIVTNPRALDPLTPFSLPCPAPAPATPPSTPQRPSPQFAPPTQPQFVQAPQQTFAQGPSSFTQGPSPFGQGPTMAPGGMQAGSPIGGGFAPGMGQTPTMMGGGGFAPGMGQGPNLMASGQSFGAQDQFAPLSGISGAGISPGIQLEHTGTMASQPGDPLLQISAGILS